ncbi:MAG: right-handed parallel beta-helix repeat-containing protein [Pseudomonadota bacterium]
MRKRIWVLVLLLAGCSSGMGDAAKTDVGNGDGTAVPTVDVTNGVLPLSSLCGNGVVDSGEKCDPLFGCPHECPQTDSCRKPKLVGDPWRCSAECAYDAITACANDDGCCAAGCTRENDNDCFKYYVDANGGSDSNNGLAPDKAWKTIAKVNGSSLVAGDSVGFKRGETWRETLVIPSSGATGNRIVFGAYGNGEKPLINPTTRVQSWRVSSGNVWEADVSSPMRQLLFDGELLPLAHDPNGDFHTIDVDSPIGTSLVDAGIASHAAELTDATVCIRTVDWEIEERKVTSFDAGTNTLNFDTAVRYAVNAGRGYYLENRRWMLDSAGEWFFDAGAGRLYLWPPGNVNPNEHTVEVSPLNTTSAVAKEEVGIYGVNRRYITVSDLAVRSAARIGAYFQDAGFLRLAHLDIRSIGGNAVPDPGYLWGRGIYVNRTPSTAAEPSTIEGNVIENTVREGIYIDGSPSVQILHNTVRNPGAVGLPRRSSAGIVAGSGSTGALVEGNEVTNAGLMGIGFSAANIVIRRNVVNRACSVLMDCGGIYTWNGIETDLGRSGGTIERNVVMNSIGNPTGTGRTTYGAHGIYFDNRSNGLTVRENASIRNRRAGIYFSNNFDDTILKNNLYGNDVAGMRFGEHGWDGMADFGPGFVHGNNASGNVLFSTSAESLGLQVESDFDPPHVAEFAGNAYVQPYNRVRAVSTIRSSPWLEQFFMLSGWQSLTGNDPTGWTTDAFYEVVPFVARTIAGPEIIANGTFNADVSSWRTWPADLPHEWVSDCGLNGGCYKGTKRADTGSVQELGYAGPFGVTKDRTYLLRFSARASKYERVRVNLMMHESPWSTLWTDTLAIGPFRSEHAFIVKSAQTLQARLQFQSGPTTGVDYYFDNVTLKEASDITYNETWDDSRILFNASSVERTLPLGEPYCDLQGNVVSGSVPLGAFESQVLLSCFCNRDGGCNNRETKDTCPSDCGG